MNKTLYTVYWIDIRSKQTSCSQSNDLKKALDLMEYLRKYPHLYRSIAMCGENEDQVGKAGVDCVKDGKTPDGVEYSWVKRRDGGQ